jgi:hypothetical protein
LLIRPFAVLLQVLRLLLLLLLVMVLQLLRLRLLELRRRLEPLWWLLELLRRLQ